MAIDTENKRRSVSGYGSLRIAPLADGAISSLDRQHMAWLYSGIAAAQPSQDAPADADVVLALVTSLAFTHATVTSVTLTTAPLE